MDEIHSQAVPLVLPLKGLWEEGKVLGSEGTAIGWQEWNCFEFYVTKERNLRAILLYWGEFLCSIRNSCTRNMGTNVKKEKKKVSFQ